jgi:2-dehydro-3-deoxy-D-arabinonate dehydratase
MLVRYARPDGSVHIGSSDNGRVRRLPVTGLADLLAGDVDRLRALVSAPGEPDAGPVVPLAPVDGATEVWAAGVT